MLKGVIFDVDGTLVDSVDAHARSWSAVLAEFGHPVEYAAVRRQIGKGGDQLMREFLTEEEIHRAGQDIERRRKEILLRDEMPGVRGFPGVRELFQRLLADGRRPVLASSAAGDELATYKERAGIADLVDLETSKDEVEESKPQPDIFAVALKKLALPPEQAIVVGDSPWDAMAATRAGLRTIGVRCGGFADEELLEAGCIALFDGPADLLARYAESPLAA